MTTAAFKTSLEEIPGMPAGSLRDTDSRDSIEAWTSIADVQILTGITSEFGIEPDAGEPSPRDWKPHSLKFFTVTRATHRCSLSAAGVCSAGSGTGGRY